jgi:hypothetical protein
MSGEHSWHVCSGKLTSLDKRRFLTNTTSLTIMRYICTCLVPSFIYLKKNIHLLLDQNPQQMPIRVAANVNRVFFSLMRPISGL